MFKTLIFLMTVAMRAIDQPTKESNEPTIMKAKKPFIVSSNPIKIVSEGGFFLAINEPKCDDCRTTLSVILPEIDTDPTFPILLDINETDCDNCRTTFSVILPKTDDGNENPKPILVDLNGEDCSDCRTTFSVILPKKAQENQPIIKLSDAKDGSSRKVLTLEFSKKVTAQEEPLKVNIASKRLKEEYTFTSKKLTIIDVQPNLQNRSIKIDYTLKKTSPVHLYLKDDTGEIVKKLINGEEQKEGMHSLIMDVKDLKENTYILTVEAHDDIDTTKIVLM